MVDPLGARRPTHGPLPEGSPELRPAADAVLDPARHQEVLAAHGERIVIGGTDRCGRSVVVKVDRDAARHQREAHVLRALHATDIGVPEILDARLGDDVSSACVLVLERVEGRPLSPEDDEATWAAVGEVLAGIHHAIDDPSDLAFAGQTDGSFVDHLRAWAEHDRHEALDDGWMTAPEADRHRHLVGEAIDRTDEAPQVLLHGDCAPQHWLLGPLAVAPRPVDLGDAGGGDPAYDLMVLTLLTAHRLAAVLDGYGAGAALREHFDAVLPGYRVLRLSGEVSWLREHGFDPSPAHARLTAALR